LKPGTIKSSSQASYTQPTSGPSISSKSQQPVDAESATTNIPAKNINFVENYKNWCVSPVLNDIYKQDIKLPIIHFKEYRLLSSTLWEQLKYFSFLAITAPDQAAVDLARFLKKDPSVVDKGAAAEQNSVEELDPDDENFIIHSLKATQGVINDTFSAVGQILNKLKIDTPDMSRANADDPYEGLYSPEETKFNYTFPYYTSLLKSKDSSFSEGYSGDGKGALPTFLDNLSNKYKARDPKKGARALVEPGMYIEKTQFYNFGKNEESISFSFPLLNTISQEQINENYQFLFLLIYQNTMYRKDRSAFIPPCIYEVLVPGTRYIKWAYISRLSVSFLGTRRMVEVDSGIGVFKTIVPEAYNVNITVTGLHEEAGNFLIRSAANNFSDIKIRDITSSQSLIPPPDEAIPQSEPVPAISDRIPLQPATSPPPPEPIRPIPNILPPLT
jgi:hypothetical protein